MAYKPMVILPLLWLLFVLPGFSHAQAGPSRCSVDSKQGACISPSSCSTHRGKTKSGICTGAGVQCCYDIPCSTGSVCTWVDQCNGDAKPDLCPGPDNFQCCLKTSTSAPAPPTPGRGTPIFLALGDSYAAGTGSTDNYIGTSGACLRSPVSYPELLASRFSAFLTSKACFGAHISDVRAQLQELKVQNWNWAATTLVTLSVGGNDAGFREVLERCYPSNRTWGDGTIPLGGTGQEGIDRPCDVSDKARYISNVLPGELVELYKTVSNLARNAKIVVTGYPKLFTDKNCGPWTHFMKEELVLLNDLGDRLGNVIGGSVQTADGFAASAGGGRILYADVRNKFLGHALCTAEEWINNGTPENEGWQFPPVGGSRESFHPNAKGQVAYANLVATCYTGGSCF